MSDSSERWINIFKISCDKESYYFSYSMDGISYQEVANASTQFLACEVASRCFTGTVIGLYAGACQKTEAVMRVKTFEIKTIGNKRIQRI